MQTDLTGFIHAFEQKRVFAYPTEAVFGLGCDPLSEAAMTQLLSLKSRPVEKGVILIAHSLGQLRPFIEFDEVPRAHHGRILATWPGPYTWLMPKSKRTPDWISGDSDLVAVRVSNHPLVQQLCKTVNSPLVSTSANPAGQAPAQSLEQVNKYFGKDVFVVDGELGDQDSPSTIINSLNLETLR